MIAGAEEGRERRCKLVFLTETEEVDDLREHKQQREERIQTE